MRVVCLYKRETDYGREVEEYLDDIARSNVGNGVEVLDPDSTEGEMFAQARDIVRYPAIVAVDSNTGSVVQEWIGLPLPSMDEVIYYLNN